MVKDWNQLERVMARLGKALEYPLKGHNYQATLLLEFKYQLDYHFPSDFLIHPTTTIPQLLQLDYY